MPSFTKIAIKQTFIKLLDEKPLSQITVKNIVETCGINRNSFYYHFADIPSLIEEIVREEADRIIEAYPTVDSIEMCLDAAFDFAEQNRRAMLHIYNSVNRAIFEHYLWNACEYVVTAYGGVLFADQPISEEDRAVIIRFYKCACFGCVIDFMESGMRGDVRLNVRRICELKKGSLEDMVARSLRA